MKKHLRNLFFCNKRLGKVMATNKCALTAAELDKKFDANKEDVLCYFDLSRAVRPGLNPQKST